MPTTVFPLTSHRNGFAIYIVINHNLAALAYLIEIPKIPTDFDCATLGATFPKEVCHLDLRTARLT